MTAKIKRKKISLNKGPHINSHASTRTSDQQHHPMFSLEYMQDSYCITKCTKEEKAVFHIVWIDSKFDLYDHA